MVTGATEPAAYGDGSGGYYPPPGGGPAAPGPGSFTSNAQWAQYAEQQLQGIVNESHLSAALGKYLTGQIVTADQRGIADQAIAIAGYPPVSGPGGYPPAFHTGGGGGGGQGGEKKFVTANGHETLHMIAQANHITEARLVSLNPGLKHLVGTRKPVPKGTRVRVS